jgi:hypothetical protein
MPSRHTWTNSTFMGVAFEMVWLALGLADRGDLANELVAKRPSKLATLASAIAVLRSSTERIGARRALGGSSPGEFIAD